MGKTSSERVLRHQQRWRDRQAFARQKSRELFELVHGRRSLTEGEVERVGQLSHELRMQLDPYEYAAASEAGEAA